MIISNLDFIVEDTSGNTDKGDCTTKQKREVIENSYNHVVREHVISLGVAAEEQNRYRRVIHTIMGEAGIIDSQKTVDKSPKDKRYKPFNKSPYGEFVNYERREDGGRGKRVNSYLLNEVGMSKVKEILATHVTDRCLTKNQIQSAKGFRNELQTKMDVEFLKSYLEYKGIPFKDELGRVTFCAPSIENENKVIPYTCYYNNPTTVQFKSTKRDKDFNTVFWFIHSLEIPALCNDAQEKAIRAARIFREYWNLQFNGKTEWGVKTDGKTSTKPVQSTSGDETSIQSVNADELAAEVKALRGTVEQLTSMMAILMKHLNCDVPVIDVSATSDKDEGKIGTKTAIINRILEHSQPLPEQKRYKSITLE
ncbi:MAG: hypothetical protein IKZ07_06325 [Akkermansia sp.]|nr:hypothetical protein [Akkermansia sp.]